LTSKQIENQARHEARRRREDIEEIGERAVGVGYGERGERGA
jgi:hypothetical protein